MNITITGGDLPLAQALAASLAASGRIRLIVAEPPAAAPAGTEVFRGDIRNPAFAEEALQGSDCLVHLASLSVHGPAAEAVDCASRGTYVLMGAAARAGVDRVVLGSTMALFDRLPPHWRISEQWRPQPGDDLQQLSPWLAELSAREFARTAPPNPPVVCLRLGSVSPEPPSGAEALNCLHPDDALRALERALEFEPPPNGWQVYHITSGGPRLTAAARPPLNFAPLHTHTTKLPPPHAPTNPLPHTPAASHAPRKRLVLFGAGGPLGAAAAKVLAEDYVLRLTDIQPIEEIHRTGKRQSPTAPLPEPLGPPHEMRVVDVTDPQQVSDACRGMDAILNCTVIRHDPAEAFRVNTVGAYHIARAAVEHGIRRVVQTGPQLVALAGQDGYWTDYDVPGDAPPRASDHLYGHSKYLGQEILRVFAENHGLEVPVLLFCIFVDPEQDRYPVYPFTVSWNDAARALRRAVEVESLPSPYEVMNVLADLPHRRFCNERARLLLGWEPRDTLEPGWTLPNE